VSVRTVPDIRARAAALYEAAAPALAGAGWILTVLTQWPVQAGLAATGDQVWAELLDGIARWESEPERTP